MSESIIEAVYNKNRLGPMDVIKAYLEVTKPISVLLLVFTAVATMIVAIAFNGPMSNLDIAIAVAAVTLACAGSNAVSCYVDRDLDATMERTQKRPIPQGRISPPIRALYWGLFLFGASLALALMLNPLSFIWLCGGMLGYVGIYSLWLKRRSSWNIILGGFSGGLPALFGWSAATGDVAWLPLAIAALVVLWIPNHIWSLAIFYHDDYAKVKVPMLPITCETKRALHCLLSTVVMMVVCSILIYFLGQWGSIYLVTAVITGITVLAVSLWVYLRPARKNAWVLFKFSSPYLFVLFLGMIIDVLLR